MLREENVDALRMNGLIIFLDRPLEDMRPSDRRPLADSEDKLKRLYEERYQIYAGAADLRVEISGDEESCAERIRRMVL